MLKYAFLEIIPNRKHGFVFCFLKMHFYKEYCNDFEIIYVIKLSVVGRVPPIC